MRVATVAVVLFGALAQAIPGSACTTCSNNCAVCPVALQFGHASRLRELWACLATKRASDPPSPSRYLPFALVA